MSAPARQRLTAPERRLQVVDAAIKRFAIGGMAGTSTEDIAADVELSQPYLFRLFRTKRDLFLACCEESFRRTHAAFAAADTSSGDPEERLEAMGEAYQGVLGDPDLLRFQLQMYAAAAADEALRVPIRTGFKTLIEALRDQSGVDEQRLWEFAAKGMLLNVVASLGLHEIASEDQWAAAWCDPASFAP